MVQKTFKKRNGKYKLQAKFLESIQVYEKIVNVILFDSKKRYCLTCYADKINTAVFRPNETLIVRFDISSKLLGEKYYNQFFITEIHKKSELDQKKLDSAKTESDYTNVTIFQQNTEFDNQ